jgi:hypothetical protein
VDIIPILLLSTDRDGRRTSAIVLPLAFELPAVANIRNFSPAAGFDQDLRTGKRAVVSRHRRQADVFRLRYLLRNVRLTPDFWPSAGNQVLRAEEQ